MRTYEILDKNGNVVSEQTMEDTMAPVALSDQSIRLKAVDGQELALSHKATVRTPENGPVVPMPYNFVTKEQVEMAQSRLNARTVKE